MLDLLNYDFSYELEGPEGFKMVSANHLFMMCMKLGRRNQFIDSTDYKELETEL
jgi:hypothetical protein